MATIFTILIVAISWLFDCKPKNLYLVWDICCTSLIISFLFWLLFGKKLGINPTAENIEKYAIDKGWLSA